MTAERAPEEVRGRSRVMPPKLGKHTGNLARTRP